MWFVGVSQYVNGNAGSLEGANLGYGARGESGESDGVAHAA